MARLALCVILHELGGPSIDNSLPGGGWSPVDPGWGYRPPVDPGYGRPGGGWDGNYPSTGPVRPGRPVDPGYGRPEWSGPVDPGYGRPDWGGGRPDNSLPWGPGRPTPPIYYPDVPPGETKPPGLENLPPIIVWIPGMGWISAKPGAPRPGNELPETPTAEPK